MPWGQTSGRTVPLPANWTTIRAQVKANAHGRCQWVRPDGTHCRAWGRDCDHIADPDNDSLDNLRWLCAYHHGQHTAEQGHQAAAAQRAKLRIPKRRPPGLR